MKTLFQCEICGTIYDDEQTALECESKGEPNRIPIGVVVGGHAKSPNMVFVVADNHITWHHGELSFWVFRDEVYCDDYSAESVTLGDKYTGYDNQLDENDRLTEHHRQLPCYQRMLAFAKQHGIKLTAWDGEKIVEL